MQQKVLFVLLSLILSTGCGLRERELELEKRISEVNQKEQELMLKEDSLQRKEEELAHREKLLDSASNKFTDSLIGDSLAVVYPGLPGKWNVTMRCIETTCPGSAVGDTKNEQWVISYQENKIVANAISDNQLVRVYSGAFTGSTLELTAQHEPNPMEEKTKMVVRLQVLKENELTGRREIIRAEECRIVYSLDFKKQ